MYGEIPEPDRNDDGAEEPVTKSWISLSWTASDQYRVVTLLAVLGVVAATGMAVFGLPPVDLHGPLHRFGVMDPLCGGTRAARFTAQGELGLAWKYNPLGMLTMALAFLATARTILGFTSGRWLSVAVTWTTGRWRLATVVTLVLLVALEIRQQLRADLLIAGT